MARRTRKPKLKSVESLTHGDASRINIPTAEYQSMMRKEQQSPIRVAYERRNRDLDPQLVWRGKDEQDWSDLVVNAPPLYIQEKVHPKALIDDLLQRTQSDVQAADPQIDLFADFNGIPEDSSKTEFYQHDANWTNRMILGDSLRVMASLAEREGLRGKVQCIYIDPPYGIKFNSNFQWSTSSRVVTDGRTSHITREPEQVRAFRDTWRDGIHSYLAYLRDRLTVARDLLTESGSVFVQIGEENVHRVRALMDEVFSDKNFVAAISFKKTGGFDSGSIPTICDYVIWYSRSKNRLKYRPLFTEKVFGEGSGERYKSCLLASGESCPVSKIVNNDGEIELPDGAKLYLGGPLTSEGAPKNPFSFFFEGKTFSHKQNQHWKTTELGLNRLARAGRIFRTANFVNYRLFLNDFAATILSNMWTDTMGTAERDKVYVVQTVSRIAQRCILMTTDPGDLVLDPTCGSGTTAFVSEQWGRRWITIDTSRVALALARARIMGGRYPYYLLADSSEGKIKEAEITRKFPSEAPTNGNIRHGFVYERIPHITLKSIAKDVEIDVIWEKFQETMEPLRQKLCDLLKTSWEEWQIPRKVGEAWSASARKVHAEWWDQRIARQKEIDASIAAKADYEYLYDKPYEDKGIVRVAGPFTVESLSPHRELEVDENDELIDKVADMRSHYGKGMDFTQSILENLKVAGVQQAHKENRISFISLTPWPGDMICAEGRYIEGSESGSEKRAGIFIGPEFGSVSRLDLVAAAREAGDADFDVLIACAFNFDAHSTEFDKLGRIPVVKARMNADLHMADDLKNTGKGNLFVIFGEPDIDILDAEDGQIQVKVNGVDVFHPQTGEIHSDGPDGIACWFIDTDYNKESFFVRHAYFLGASDPYKVLKTTLKAEINHEAWESLHSDTSRPFPKPSTGHIAVKVINHLGDEVIKVFRVENSTGKPSACNE
ncbi:MAG: site-specific DNA-methyltransferase [Gammaproteobacteria bacterium]|nr:site-specific DNA-methyltransferase [Gammaproteobacteria bacterium]MYH86056.1 site-specific DNA-methyltransferase [Gammaproteobacteria bacterium]